MKEGYLNTFNVFSKERLKNLGYLPRWIILSIDIFFVIASIFVGGYILKGIGLSFFPLINPLAFYSLFIGVHIFFFWFFKIYAGIIRHTTITDGIKLFWSELSTFTVLYIINTISDSFFDQKLFLTTRVMIYCAITYCFALFFRIMVKNVFEQYIHTVVNNNRIKTIIYGTGEGAIAIANAILSENPKRFKLMGFLVQNEAGFHKNSLIMNLPLITTNRRVPVVLRKMRVESLIIAQDNYLNNEQRMMIIDDCLNHNIKVYSLPPLSDISDQRNIAANIRNIKIQDLLERNPIVLNNNIICDHLNEKTILVSGGAGSIGSEIVWQISKFKPKRILVLDQAETPLHHMILELEKAQVGIEIIALVADIRNMEMMERIFLNYHPQVIYHAAAYKHVPLMEENPEQAIFTNVKGTKNLADLAVKYNTERFVMVSTDKAVNPSNIMGASKRISEKYVQSLNEYLKSKQNVKTKFITTRFGNVLGSNGSVVPLFTKQIEQGGPITITHPDIIRYFMTIPEACQLVLEAGSMGVGGEIYIFDMGKPVKIIDLAYKMIKLAGMTPEKDIKIKVIGLRPGEKLYEELLNDSSKTLPTHHEKIMIATDIHDNYECLNEDINMLINYAQDLDTEKMVLAMKKLVPEFKSLNSVFQKLDIDEIKNIDLPNLS